MSDVASGIVGEPYTPAGRSAVFDVPSYDDIADLNVLFKRFADTAAGVGETSPTVLTDRTSSFAITEADVKARRVFLCTSSSALTAALPSLAALPAASGLSEGDRVVLIQGGSGKVTLTGVSLAGSPSTTGQYTGVSATVHAGKWWCLPFGSGSGPGPDPTDLLAPSLDAAQGANAFVALDWTPNASSAPATGYKVQHAHLLDSTWTTTDVGLVTSAHVTGLVNGDTYKFQVLAYDATRTSAASNQLTAIPETDSPGELLPPKLLTAQSGDAKATITWEAPAGSGPFDSYVVEYSVAGSGQWTDISVGLVTSVDVNGLTNGKTYSFRARTTALSPQATSLPSNVLNATPGDGSSPMPPKITKVSAGDTQLTVTWSRPTSGPTPTSYVLEWAVASSKYEPMWPDADPRLIGITWNSKNVGDVLGATIYSLTNDVTYLVRARSVKDTVTSEPGPSESGTPKVPDPVGPVITGYDSTYETSDYVIYLFTAPGKRTMQVKGTGTAKILAIGAGGGRGYHVIDPDLAVSGWRYRGGPGGSGEVNCASKAVIPEFQLVDGDYSVTVGAAGACATNESSQGEAGGRTLVSGAGVDITCQGGGGGGSALTNAAYAYSGGAGGGKHYWDAVALMYSQATPTSGTKAGENRDGADAIQSNQADNGRIVLTGGGGGLGGSGRPGDGSTRGDSMWPGWLPADAENAAWKLWVTECTRWTDGITYGFAVGGSPWAPYADIKGAINDPNMKVYGRGIGPTPDVSSGVGPPVHGVVAIGVKKGAAPELPDITGGAKYVIDDYVYHVFTDGGNYNLRVNGAYPIEGTAVVAEVLAVGGGGAGGGVTYPPVNPTWDGLMYFGGSGGGGQAYLEDGKLPVVTLQPGTFAVGIAGEQYCAQTRGDIPAADGNKTTFSGPSADITAIGGGGGNSGAPDATAPTTGWSGGGGGWSCLWKGGQGDAPIAYYTSKGGQGSGGGKGTPGFITYSWTQNTNCTGGGGGSVKNAGPAGNRTSYGGTGWKPDAVVDGQRWVEIFNRLSIGHVGCGGGVVDTAHENPDLNPKLNNRYGEGGAAMNKGKPGLLIVCYPVRPKAADPAKPAPRKRSSKAVD